MNLRIFRVRAFLLFTLLPGLASSQQPSLESHPATVTKEPVHVIFDAVVTDSSGNPVSNLPKDVFTVLDNGQPAKLLAFRPPAPAPSPGQVDSSTEVIFIIDEINADYNTVTYARDELHKFLLQNNGSLAQPTCLGFLTDSGLNLQTQPTTDGKALADALDQQLHGFRIDQRGTGFYGAEDRLKRSIDGFESLIAQERHTGFRKMAIWLSPGWPLLSGPHSTLSEDQQAHTLKSVMDISTALRQARIVLYSIDPLRSTSSGEHTVFWQNFTKPLTRASNAELGALGLQVIVAQSGGRAIFGNQMVQDSINQSVTDLRGMYTLAIDTATSDKPTDFHTLTVQVSTPGLKVRTRAGYYPQP